jgi:hypothetical protein
MIRPLAFVVVAIALLVTGVSPAADAPGAEDGFVPLFDGKTLDGWTPQDPSAKDTFRIEDGAILCNGGFQHLFYSGKEHGAKWVNFELRADFKMAPSSNSGIFFHTENPGAKKTVVRGYECQICGDSYKKDPKKTGSLYDIKDVKESAAKDEEWSTYTIRVEGKHIVLAVNGKQTVDYTEPDPPNRRKGREGRVLSSGTFALQAHDPASRVWFRNIRVKPLP